jgi:hypothetical protein
MALQAVVLKAGAAAPRDSQSQFMTPTRRIGYTNIKLCSPAPRNTGVSRRYPQPHL